MTLNRSDVTSAMLLVLFTENKDKKMQLTGNFLSLTKSTIARILNQHLTTMSYDYYS